MDFLDFIVHIVFGGMIVLVAVVAALLIGINLGWLLILIALLAFVISWPLSRKIAQVLRG